MDLFLGQKQQIKKKKMYKIGLQIYILVTRYNNGNEKWNIDRLEDNVYYCGNISRKTLWRLGDCIELYYIFIFKFKRMMQLEDTKLFVCGISKAYKKYVFSLAS
mgnify:CR=1 FL=1